MLTIFGLIYIAILIANVIIWLKHIYCQVIVIEYFGPVIVTLCPCLTDWICANLPGEADKLNSTRFSGEWASEFFVPGETFHKPSYQSD